MVVDPVILALIAVIASAFDCIIFRYGMKEDSCSWAVLLYYHAAAVLILFPFINQNAFYVDFCSFLFLCLSSLLWVVGDLYGTKAVQYLDASVCQVYGTLKLVVVCFAGALIFSEVVTFNMMLGMALIILSVIFQMKGDRFALNKGVTYEFIAVLFVASALILDKYLTTFIADQAIVFYGFLLPVIVYGTIGYKKIPNILPALKKSRNFFLLCPILGCISYYCLIQAFATGSLGITYTIQQAGIVFVFILEVILLKTYENFVRRAFSCSICAVGAMVVCGVL